jgi:hypothetical protein
VLFCETVIIDLIMLSVAQNAVPNDSSIMSWKAYARKQSWHSLRYFPGGTEKTHEIC